MEFPSFYDPERAEPRCNPTKRAPSSDHEPDLGRSASVSGSSHPSDTMGIHLATAAVKQMGGVKGAFDD
jgi:hypothetical protein